MPLPIRTWRWATPRSSNGSTFPSQSLTNSTAPSIAGPIDGNSLFTALGGPCANNNSGDIIAQWDNAAHRWLLAQNVFNGPPYYACVAVSTSANASGLLLSLPVPAWAMAFPIIQSGDAGTTTWTQTMNNFGPGGSGFVGPEVCLYERAKLLAGTSAPDRCAFSFAPDGRQPVASRHRFPNQSAFHRMPVLHRQRR